MGLIQPPFYCRHKATSNIAHGNWRPITTAKWHNFDTTMWAKSFTRLKMSLKFLSKMD
jgi:hypothetical protein